MDETSSLSEIRTQRSTRTSDGRAGQAQTEYLVILLFGVFIGLGLFVYEETLQGGTPGVLDNLYGYIFEYYAGLVNFLNMPIF